MADPPPQMTRRRCFQCETENPPEQSFCGKCGAALVLKDYIAAQVGKVVAELPRDREALIKAEAVEVFEKAWGWAKLTFELLLIPVVAVVGLLGWWGWREFDLSKAAQSAKEQIEGTANTAKSDISQASAKSIGEVQNESNKAIAANRESASTATRLSNDVKSTASKTKDELKTEATSVRKEVENSKSELEDVKKLQPEFDSIRAQLGKATTDLAAQQKIVSSSEEFVKGVLGTHVLYTFNFGATSEGDNQGAAEPFGNSDSVTTSSIAIKNKGAKSMAVYMLVPYTPIDGTLQLQYKNLVEPPDSYFFFHNLIVMFWGDPPEDLSKETLYASFFPDKTDKDTIKQIVLRNGRIFADGEPLQKYREDDPDFKGNKWTRTAAPQPLKP